MIKGSHVIVFPRVMIQLSDQDARAMLRIDFFLFHHFFVVDVESPRLLR